MTHSIGRWIFTFLLAATPVFGQSKKFRPPAVPLVTTDPYLSVWSEADHLYDGDTRHWTGRRQPLYGMVRVDGKPYRLMGAEPRDVPPLPQVDLTVTPTRSTYDFEGSGVHVTLTFLTPLLPRDVDVMSRPLSYLTYTVRSTDGASHAVQLLDATSGLLAVFEPKQAVTWSSETAGDLTLLKIGTVDQRELGRSGDDTRIDWGYAYTAAGKNAPSAIDTAAKLLPEFASSGKITSPPIGGKPGCPASDEPVCAFCFDMGQVGPNPLEWLVIVGYDEVHSIKYYGKSLQPYWRRGGMTPAQLFTAAANDYVPLVGKCDAFDKELTTDARKLGGDAYADIIALAYRQCWAGCGIVADSAGSPHLFTKENSSNGDIATVDVIFPMDPIWVLLSPSLAKSTLAAVFQYSASSHWKFPNAPHDLGTYPVIMGRDDGGEGMPVEESGNMLILASAISQAEGSADWCKPWWPQLTMWAKYLEKYGLDPEDQLCTDDFMGHLAHNSNLSIKAILGLAAYGDLCKMTGDTANAERYMRIAKDDAAHWVTAADDGDHSRLAFDKPNTWSQKYNLVWDKILGFNVFPPQVARNEISFYKTQLQPYGLPLDSRTKLSKTDWTVWSATMAEDPADFEAITRPIVKYLNETTTRLPFVDSYVTTDIHSDGMRARPVIGGVFIKFLSDREIWKKYAANDPLKVGGWGPIPPPPQVTVILPTAKTEPAIWLYTTVKPDVDTWTKPDFDAVDWRAGIGSFGTHGTPGSVIGTEWKTGDIWLRRVVTVPATVNDTTQFLVNHDEDVEIYVDGVPAASEAGFTGGYLPMEINKSAKALLKPGAKVTLAVHCHQTEGGQVIDVGLANVVETK